MTNSDDNCTTTVQPTTSQVTSSVTTPSITTIVPNITSTTTPASVTPSELIPIEPTPSPDKQPDAMPYVYGSTAFFFVAMFCSICLFCRKRKRRN